MRAGAGVKPSEIRCVEAPWASRAEACIAIRRRVFIEEQDVPEEIEIDGLDPACRHFLAYAAGDPVATGRLKTIPEGVKIQRVAVLETARGAGIGRRLMEAMMAAAPMGWIVLDAQTQALAFYEGLGFVAEGPEFLDAGIPHRRMRLEKKGEAQ